MKAIEQTERTRKKRAFIVYLISHILYVISIPIWYFIWMFSPMLFDDPATDDARFSILMYEVFSGYIYYVLIAIVVSWILYARKRFGWAYLLNAIPITLAIASFGLMLI